MVSTPSKNISQNGNLPQIWVKITKYLKPPPTTFFFTQAFFAQNSDGCKFVYLIQLKKHSKTWQVPWQIFGASSTLKTPHLGVSKNRGPQNGWFTMENPIKMDALGVPLFSETSISWWKFIIETLEHVHFSAFSDKKWGAERCYLYPRGNGKITNFLIGHTSSSVFFPLSIVMLVFRGVFPESSKQIWSNDFFVLFFYFSRFPS